MTPIRTSPAPAPPAGSLARAWLYLVVLGLRRQARARQMVGIAVALLVFTATIIAVVRAAGGWDVANRRFNSQFTVVRQRPIGPFQRPVVEGHVVSLRYGEIADALELAPQLGIQPPPARALETGVGGAFRQVLDRAGVLVFSNWIVFSTFLSFLLPVWSLSFATESLGGEREAGTLVWLLSRPLPRPAIYLAKFVALLPWSVGLNLGGFAVLCLAAGRAGLLALGWYWPAVLWGTLAFAALFHLMSACFRRPAVIAIVYTFFLEAVLGNMPGYMKRISIGFYTRCIMFGPLEARGIAPPEKAAVYMPVGPETARVVLLGLTAVLLLLGMAVFARSEYQELA